MQLYQLDFFPPEVEHQHSHAKLRNSWKHAVQPGTMKEPFSDVYSAGDEMCYMEVAIIHLEPHGAQTHCHRKRLAERSVSLQRQGHGTEEEDRRVRRKEVKGHTHTYTPTTISFPTHT